MSELVEGARLEIVYTPKSVSRVRIPLSPPAYFSIWPVGQGVKTPPFHGGNRGSNPLRVTRPREYEASGAAEKSMDA